ncbi:hypothetical protein FP738_24410 [Vibrio parahaemolyticus]|nr:hypothetical protein [Vibrio parahaemolyticus]EGR0983097.1 hypothetical protein [Vibrio parahaemolyticus]EGR1326782.1 hypothetical protein [Vibrio parahaemolyticus]EGR1485475.1 hypothetical protein [Vibrio parahaemolyticus]EGR2005850.1 hypothetical protein [Vibrio parahaemolyticus]
MLLIVSKHLIWIYSKTKGLTIFCESKLYNKAFKSDSQRLAVSLRSSIAKRRSHLNAALCLLVFQWLKNSSISVLCPFSHSFE